MRKLKHGDGCVTLCRRKRKDGTERRFYKGRIYINGEQRTIYGKTRAECLEKLKHLREKRDKERAQRLLNIEGQPRDGQSGGKIQFRTFGEWLDEWARQCKVGKQKETYAPEFMRQVATVRDALGGLVLRKIEPLELQRYFNSMPQNNTAVKKYDIVNGSLQKAEDFGIIKRNPCKAVDKPTYKKQKRRAFALTEQCDVLAELNERYAAVFFFLCATGLRIGEFLALRPENVDFEQHFISVDGAVNIKTGARTDTKTAAGVRKVYFADGLFETIDVGTLGTYTYDGIKKAFNKVFKRLHVEGISVTHSCRHTFASMLYAVGVSDKIIQALCGHADVGTTVNIYTDILLTGASPLLDYILQLKCALKSRLILY